MYLYTHHTHTPTHIYTYTHTRTHTHAHTHPHTHTYTHFVTCGVPQRSVLSPLLFTLYILPLFKLIQSFPDISYHIYADDIHLYIKLPINSSPDSNLSLSNCNRHINFWLLSNLLLLKLNETKTELINISHSQSTFPPLFVNNSLFQPKPFITNLGFIFDTNLNYDRHISNLCKISNLHNIKCALL